MTCHYCDNICQHELGFGALNRTRATSLQWQPLWDSMAAECREELTLVEADTLLDTIEAYLQKHRFCPECRLKVLRAYRYRNKTDHLRIKIRDGYVLSAHFHHEHGSKSIPITYRNASVINLLRK